MENGVTEFLSRDQVARAINPHLLSILKIDSRHAVERVPAIQLLSARRFDVVAKALYVRLRRMSSSAWPETVYREHLRVWSGFHEGDSSGKSCFEDFRVPFDALIESMSENGFDSEMGLVPVGDDGLIIDGSHRLGVALALGQYVGIVRFGVQPNHYDSEYFRRRGLGVDIADAMALEYCRLDRSVRIAAIFPVAKGQDERIDQLLEQCGPILYRKSVVFSRSGRANLVRVLYRGESWLGEGRHESAGLRHHVEERFVSGRAVRFVFFESRSSKDLADVKSEIRALFELGNDSIHINDHHHQTIELAEQILNKNSIHFMNHARPAVLPRFDELFGKLNAWMDANGVDREQLCVDGSGVLAAYGLRDVNDLDFLYCGAPEPDTGDEFLSCHNEMAMHYQSRIDELVIDPANYFWYRGVKFVALPIVRAMKQRRNEAKDRRDLVRIDSLDEGGRAVAFGLKLCAAVPEALYSVRHRFVARLKKMVPQSLKPLAKTIYDLPLTIRESMGPADRRITYRGFELCYSRGTSLIRMINRGEVYEQRLSAYVVELLKKKPDGLFIDIGANIGLISLNVLHELPDVRIWAFEPGPHQAALFEQTIELNSLAGKVMLRQTALTNSAGTAEFRTHSTRHASGDGFLDTERAGRSSSVIVQTEMLDSYWEAQGAPGVSLIKIDTEGAELWVLQGALKMLELARPVIVFELDARNLRPYPYDPLDIFDFLEEQDYVLKEISGAEVSREGIDDAMTHCSDFVAMPVHRVE